MERRWKLYVYNLEAGQRPAIFTFSNHISARTMFELVREGVQRKGLPISLTLASVSEVEKVEATF